MYDERYTACLLKYNNVLFGKCATRYKRKILPPSTGLKLGNASLHRRKRVVLKRSE